MARGFESLILSCGRSSSFGRARDCGSRGWGFEFPRSLNRRTGRIGIASVLKTVAVRKRGHVGSNPTSSSEVSVAERQGIRLQPEMDVGSTPIRDSRKTARTVSDRTANARSSERVWGFESSVFRRRGEWCNGNTRGPRPRSQGSNPCSPARKMILRCKIRLWRVVQWWQEVRDGVEKHDGRGEVEIGRADTICIENDDERRRGAIEVLVQHRGGRCAHGPTAEASDLRSEGSRFESWWAYRATVAQRQRRRFQEPKVGGSNPLSRTHGRVPQRQRGPVEGRFSEGSNPSSPTKYGFVAEGFSTGLKSRRHWVDSSRSHRDINLSHFDIKLIHAIACDYMLEHVVICPRRPIGRVVRFRTEMLVVRVHSRVPWEVI